MRVFVAGATGAIGRPLLPLLVARGHQVVGLTRKKERVAQIRAAGAEGVLGDVLDAEGLRERVKAARPEVVIHQLTDIPQKIDPRRYEEQFAGNDRLRVAGTANLVAAARAAGVRRIVAQSIAFAYRPDGPMVKDEAAALWLEAPAPFGRTVAAVKSLEDAVHGSGAEGIILRYGLFYGPGTAYARDGAMADLVRKRKFPLAGKATGVYSFIAVQDAAAAAASAVDSGAPGVYNLVDDEPAPLGEWLPAFAAAVGAPAPVHVPLFMVKMLAGPIAVYAMTEQRGASNARARRDLGFKPSYPSWRQGFVANH